MSTAIYSTEYPTEPPEPTEPAEETAAAVPATSTGPRYTRPAGTLTVDGLCRLLQLGPTAVPVLAQRGDIDVRLPPPRPGYCPLLADVRIVRLRRSLSSDTTLLAELRAEHPPEKRDVHLHRMIALGGVLRILGR